MTVALYRSITHQESLQTQEDSIIAYAQSNGLNVENVLIDFSPFSKAFDERVEVKEFMKYMTESNIVFVHDLWVFSNQADELVKAFTCLFKKKIPLYIASKKIKLEHDSPAFLVLGLIDAIREEGNQEGRPSLGRPVGSISRSKFDGHRIQILNMLQDGKNVSEISRELKVNRSSLKDYINSRRLKEIAKSRSEEMERSFMLAGSNQEENKEKIIQAIQCPFKYPQQNLNS